jgi:hypothetical protein
MEDLRLLVPVKDGYQTKTRRATFHESRDGVHAQQQRQRQQWQRPSYAGAGARGDVLRRPASAAAGRSPARGRARRRAVVQNRQRRVRQ